VEDVTIAEILGGSVREVVEEVAKMQQLCEISTKSFTVLR